MRNALLAAVVLVLAAACNPGKPAAPAATQAKPEAAKPEATPVAPTEVVLWHSYRESEKAAMDQLVEKFNSERKDIRIRVLNVPYDAFIDKVSIATPRGQGPDIFVFAHNMIGEWVDHTKILEPLSDRVAPDVLKRFIPATVRALVYKQSLYGLPLAFKSLALFYNPDLVKTPPETSDQFVEAAKAATGQGRYGLAYEAGLLYYLAPFIHGFGGTILDDHGQPHVSEKPVADALAFVKGLVKAGVVPSGVNSAMVTSLFNDGKVAMVINGPWFLGEIAPGRAFKVAQLPKMPGGTPAKPFLGSEAVYLSSFSKNKDAAVKVMDWLTTDDAAVVRLKVGHQTVANQAVYARDDVKSDPVVSTFRAQAEDTVLMPSRPEMQVVWSTMDMAINKSAFGDADLSKALADAQAKILADIAKMAK